jgi:murein DD-endopeptidase MepM/ murein hydrolase activator NlpD
MGGIVVASAPAYAAQAAQAAPVSAAPIAADLADLKEQAAGLKEKVTAANEKLKAAESALKKADDAVAKAAERQESASKQVATAASDVKSARHELGMVQFGANLARTFESRAKIDEAPLVPDNQGLLGMTSLADLPEEKPSLVNLTLEATAAERDATISAIQADWAGAGARADLRDAAHAVTTAQAARDEAAEAHKSAAVPADEARAQLEAAEAKVAEAEEKQRAKERKRAAKKAARDAKRVVKPATGHTTSPYGMRTHPITGVYKLHSGTDFSYGDGKAYAAKAGTVAAITWDGAYGNMVTISHGDGLKTRYAHLAQPTVSTGQKVSAGTAVGRIGATGYATGPHLHFEVLKNGEFVNADSYLGQ